MIGCDWSSDVCSSDLTLIFALAGQGLSYVAAKANIKVTNKDGSVVLKENTDYKIQNSEIGRASCRERV